ncbi:hypothetical protein RQP46_006860 [Phenoliferia psychrophenolica]
MGEQQPLLGRGGSVPPPKGLNPLAAAFSFSPSGSATASTSSSSSSSLKPALAVHPAPAPSASSSAAPPPPPELITSPSTEDLQWDLRRSHVLSPHTRGNSLGNESEFSSFASDDDVPSLRTFRRVHAWVQFPVSFLLTAALFVGLAVWKKEVRWFDFGLGAGSWLASETIKLWCFELLTHERTDKDGQVIRGTGLALPTLVMAVVQELLRLGAVIAAVGLLPEPTLSSLAPTQPPPSSPPRSPHRPLPPLDTLFFSALWLAMGWACVEILWNSRDFYRRMSLYDDVLPTDDGEWDEEEDAVTIETYDYGATALTPRGGDAATTTDKRVTMRDPAGDSELTREEREADVEAQIRQDERDEVEGQLGAPLYAIPVAVVVIWRVDSILLSLVLTLFMSLPFRTTSPSIVPFPVWPTFAAAAFTHVLLALLWVLRIPSVGIPAVSYMTLVILMLLLFAVLAAWGALE